jgi:hypothetical protein
MAWQRHNLNLGQVMLEERQRVFVYQFTESAYLSRILVHKI